MEPAYIAIMVLVLIAIRSWFIDKLTFYLFGVKLDSALSYTILLILSILIFVIIIPNQNVIPTDKYVEYFTELCAFSILGLIVGRILDKTFHLFI